MNDKKWILIFICWVLAVFSTMGSLFFSEVMKYPPCILCWYQRICMYPLAILFLPAILSFDKSVLKFTFPLTCIGWFIAVYHNLLYYKILPESAAPCIQGISCTTIQIEWLGFVTIPFLSLLGFTLILVILIYLHRTIKNEK